MSDASVLDKPVTGDTGTDEPLVAHYVYKTGPLQADGAEQRALCGKMWKPSTYDTAGLPICSACKEIARKAGIL